MRRKARAYCYSLVMGLALLVLTGYQSLDSHSGMALQNEEYTQARSHFHTRLLKQGPAPQPGEPLHALSDAQRVTYSANPPLSGWLSLPPKGHGSRRFPAVLFLHGGFAIGEDDWQMAKPYRDAGYVVLMPVLRGENGQSGTYSLFYNEVDDVLAAANYLATVPYVDASHLYVAGHSVGGTLTLLAAMSSARFRAAASFSGSPDQVAWSVGQKQVIPFDTSHQGEFEMRSPVAYATSFKCPVRMYYGTEEAWCRAPSQATAERAKLRGLDVRTVVIPGDHLSEVPQAMQESITFFQSR